MVHDIRWILGFGRGSREFDYTRRHHISKSCKRQISPSIMGFIYNDDRPTQAQNVHKRRLRFAVRVRKHILHPTGGDIDKVLCQGTILIIDFAAGCVLYTE
jgi:hypothetical protein